MMEKLYEYGIDLHMLFVDFRQAFDSINRKRLYEPMEWMKIPDKLIRLTRMTMNTSQAKVKKDNTLSAKFEFNTGVKQGGGLSAALFIVALHSVIKSTDQRATIYTKSSQICAYADDIVIITRCREKIIDIYKEIKEKARKIRLEENERKRNYMIMSTSESRRKTQDLKVEGKLFTGVIGGFKYLGNTINNGNRNNNCFKEGI
jgi:sorting nexin-29